MLLLLVVRCNTERSNSAYTTFHGRFGKTVDGLNTIFTGISMIGLLREGNVFYVSPAHSEMLILQIDFVFSKAFLS